MLSNKLFINSIWMIAWRWSSRLMGLISTIILARILYPEEYGIVAMATLIVMSLEIFTNVGADKYLIRKTDTDEEDYNTAWTIHVLLFLAIGGALFLSADRLADFFSEPKLRDVLTWLSLAVMLTGFNSIKLTEHRKNLRFHKIFLYETCKKTVGFVTTVSLAFILQSYWAMIIGTIAFRVSGVALSYVFAPYKPKFCVTRLNTQWDFCRWFVLRSITGLLRAKSDQFIVSYYFGADAMGKYTMAYHISSLPITEVLMAVNDVLYSGFSKLLETPKRLGQAYLKSVGALLSLILPAAFGLALTAEDVVSVLLGERWLTITDLIVVIVLVIATQSLISTAVNVLTVVGKVKLLAIIDWLTIGILLPALLLAGLFGDILDLAWARALIAVFPMVALVVATVRFLPITLADFARTFGRPFAAAVGMSGVLVLLNHTWQISLLALLGKILLGAVSYLILIILIWHWSGKPDSGEKFLIEKLNVVLGKFSRFTNGWRIKV